MSPEAHVQQWRALTDPARRPALYYRVCRAMRAARTGRINADTLDRLIQRHAYIERITR